MSQKPSFTFSEQREIFDIAKERAARLMDEIAQVAHVSAERVAESRELIEKVEAMLRRR